MARRVSAEEELELRASAEELAHAEHIAQEVRAKHYRLVGDIARAGGRVSEIAQILGVTRETVYAAIRRAEERD